MLCTVPRLAKKTERAHDVPFFWFCLNFSLVLVILIATKSAVGMRVTITVLSGTFALDLENRMNIHILKPILYTSRNDKIVALKFFIISLNFAPVLCHPLDLIKNCTFFFIWHRLYLFSHASIWSRHRYRAGGIF